MFRRVIYVVLFLVPVLSLTSTAQTIEPTADTYVRGSGNTDTNYSTEGNIYIKHSNGGSTDRKGYIRFEISGATAEASLDLTVTSNNEGGGGSTPQVFTVEVYGLSEALDHTWVESEITWNNAPANSTSNHDFTADATFLGSFLVDQTPVGETLTFSDPALADFISRDTDNEITLLLRRTSGNGSHNLGFASKEHATRSPITLHVRAATQAFRPTPAPEATDVPHDAVLSWTPGMFASPANGHIVYLSDNFMDVNDGIGGTPQDANSYVPASRFDFGTTYYWRVDEVNAAPDNTVFKGAVWQFEVEPYSIPIPGDTIAVTASSVSNEFSGPEKTVDGSGLGTDGTHDMAAQSMWFTASVDLDPWIQYDFDQVRKLDTMLVWNSNGAAEMAIGWGVKDVIIEYSVDGENWDVLADATQFSRAPGLPTYSQYDTIDFGGAAAKHVRLNIESNWGGILMSYGLSEVQFSMIPAEARTPDPESGTGDLLPDAAVTWRAGRGAAQHRIYVDTDMNAVADGTAPSVSSSTHSLDLALLDLELGQTYYWRVDEVNEAQVPSVWAGPVWDFSTVPYLTVEDFDSYGNLSPNRPFQTWLDGYGYSADEFYTVAYSGNGTGAGIGHDIWGLSSPHFDGNIMERSNTMAGSAQSMPFYYSNTGGVASQTERTFAVPQDWTVGGAKTLSIAFAGQAGNTGTLYVKINGTKVTYDRDPENLTLGMWQAWNIDLSAMNVQAVTKLEIGVEGSGASGMLLIDDIRLYAQPGEVITPTDPGTANLVGAWNFDEGSGTIVIDSSGNGRNGTIVDATWDTGKQGSALSFNGTSSYVNIDGFKGINAVDGVQPAFTITNWVRTTSESGDTEMVTWGASTGTATRLTWRVHQGRVRTEHNAGNLRGNTYVNDGEWHHVALVVTEGANLRPENTKLYVDGLEDSTFSGDDDTYQLVAEHDVRIGMSGPQNGRYFPGALDEVRIYDRALSDGEVLNLAGRTTPVDKPF